MIVYIAGMQRSGSTFAFNVAREILRKRGSLYQNYATEIASELVAARDAQHVLLKAHRMDALGILLARQKAIRVICTFRRPEDAVASWMTAFGSSEENAVETVREWLSFYDQVQDVALTVDYDTIDKHPFVAARQIGRLLFPNIGWMESRRIVRRHSKKSVKATTDQLVPSDSAVLDIGFTYYHKDTLYHRSHVQTIKSRSASDILPEAQVSRIRQALRTSSNSRTGKDPVFDRGGARPA